MGSNGAIANLKIQISNGTANFFHLDFRFQLEFGNDPRIVDK